MRRVVFLLVSIAVTYAEECPEFATREEAFCHYDYHSSFSVTHARILSKSPEHDDNGNLGYNYDVEHLETFKKLRLLPELPKTFASGSPSANPNIDGFDFVVGKEYVISGYLDFDDFWHVVLDCGKSHRLLMEWNQMLPEEKEAMRTYTCYIAPT